MPCPFKRDVRVSFIFMSQSVHDSGQAGPCDAGTDLLVEALTCRPHPPRPEALWTLWGEVESRIVGPRACALVEGRSFLHEPPPLPASSSSWAFSLWQLLSWTLDLDGHPVISGPWSQALRQVSPVPKCR